MTPLPVSEEWKIKRKGRKDRERVDSDGHVYGYLDQGAINSLDDRDILWKHTLTRGKGISGDLKSLYQNRSKGGYDKLECGKIKKIKVLDTLLVIITLPAVFILLYIFLMIKNLDKPSNVVLPAISRACAEGMVKENECYIVRKANPEEFGTGGWYYMDGKKKIKMLLGGRNPAHELSYIFRELNRNSFLVKGRIDEEWTQRNGCLTFNVESWYLIAPIKRDYGPRYYRDEQRWFYPEDYLDLYDLEQGDYTPFEDWEAWGRNAGN